jgi:hypothetical protein
MVALLFLSAATHLEAIILLALFSCQLSEIVPSKTGKGAGQLDTG